MDVSIITGADGSLTVHRESCKKIADRDTQGVDDLLSTNPGGLTTAKKASCCKPTDATMEEIEQAGWDRLEADANQAAEEALQDDVEGDLEEQAAADEDLIGDVDEGSTAADEDLIGIANAPAREAGDTSTKAKGKTAAKVAAAKTEAKELNGLEALKKVADYLDIDLGKKPVFPGFGRAFKTAAKQSLYINSKGNADVRATDAEQADEWATLDHIERRSGNYVRVTISAL